MKNKKINLPRPDTPFKWALCIAACLIIAGGVLLVLRTVHNSPSAPTPVTASSLTKGESGASKQASNSSQGTEESATQNQASAKNNTSSSGTLVAPSGDFVSNHHPNVSGKPAPSTITSVCNGTPGATCKITFTKDGETKSLAAQTIDNGGSTYWTNWDINKIGLSEGTWKIQAVSSLNDQTKTTSDALDLVVGS